ncbi:MAG: leucine-rich repeat protein, partial [Bacteroidaceae bacterium]|nr:leucine-rich repeat protein [Bacteroidaceae bacterium]
MNNLTSMRSCRTSASSNRGGWYYAEHQCIKCFSETSRFLILLLLSLLGSVSASASAPFNVNGIWYGFIDDKPGEVEVTFEKENYPAYIGDIVIPASIEYGGTTYSVTKIGRKAFYGCNNVTSVSLNNNVTTIGERAFTNCLQLKSLTNTDAVTTIGNSGLAGCSALSELNFPNLEYADAESFAGCTSLTSITLERTTPPTLGVNAFYNVFTNDIFLYVPSGAVDTYKQADVWKDFRVWAIGSRVTPFSAENEQGITICYEPTSAGICKVIAWSELEEVECYAGDIVIPDSVTDDMNNIYAVTEIDDWAFGGCDEVTSVTLGNEVTTIGRGSFIGCYNLSTVKWSEKLDSIGDEAFYDVSLDILVSPRTTPPALGEDVFAKEQTYATYLLVPSEAVATYKQADVWKKFDVWANNINIPSPFSAVNEQGTTIYYRPTSLTTCKVTAKFEEEKKGEKDEKGGKDDKGGDYEESEGYTGDIIIPNSVVDDMDNTYMVTGIGEYAFDNSEITSITLNGPVTFIGEGAFMYSRNLASIILPCATPPTLDERVFEGITADNVYLSVPIDAMTAYKQADVWKTFEVWGNGTALPAPFSAVNEQGTTICYRPTWGNTCKVIPVYGDVAAYTGDITIPATVENDGTTYTVTKIGAEAFAKSGITSIALGDNVTTIAEYAFSVCSGLTTVTNTDAVTT